MVKVVIMIIKQTLFTAGPRINLHSYFFLYNRLFFLKLIITLFFLLAYFLYFYYCIQFAAEVKVSGCWMSDKLPSSRLPGKYITHWAIPSALTLSFNEAGKGSDL